MTTTAIFVELLIIGIQALVWVIILLAAFGFEFSGRFEQIKLDGLDVLVVGGVLAICYSFGIVIDRVADVLSGRLRAGELVTRLRWLEPYTGGAADRAPGFELAFREGRAFEVLNYYRSRFRVARALVLNVFLTTVAAVLYGIVALPSQHINRFSTLTLAIALGGWLTLVSLLAAGLIENQYNARKALAAKLLDAGGDIVEPAQNPATGADG